MRVLGIAWLGIQTPEFAQMVKFATEVLGLTPFRLKTDTAKFALPDGDLFEIFGPTSPEHTYSRCPVAGFLVDAIDAAREEMEDRGVEFLGPTVRHHSGAAWAHFRAPDGHVYEITYHPERPVDKGGLTVTP